jgi:hypothetical protein
VFQKWKKRWDRCLHAGGKYFEGDSGRKALWWVLRFLRQSGKFWIKLRTILKSKTKFMLSALQRSLWIELRLYTTFVAKNFPQIPTRKWMEGLIWWTGINSIKKHNSIQWWYRPPSVVGEGVLKPQDQNLKAELYWTI